VPPFLLYTRPNARRAALLDDLLALAEAGQQQAVDAAVLMLADFFVNGQDSRFARKLQGLPIWELKTQARGGAKGGMRVYFYFLSDGSARIVNAESKEGTTPGPAFKEAAQAAYADDKRS
jgi:hypothetical protein